MSGSYFNNKSSVGEIALLFPGEFFISNELHNIIPMEIITSIIK